MVTDVQLKDFYLQFIYNAKSDIQSYNEDLEKIIYDKKIVRKYLEDKVDILKDCFDINLNDIKTEWVDAQYNSKEYLYNLAIVALRNIGEHPHKIVLIQLSKYCTLLRNENKYKKLIELATKRNKLKLRDYKRYVNAFYIKVHKCLLEGNGYKFAYGIGTYVINHWKLDGDKIKKRYILDYAATQAKKKELLEKGIKLYDEKEAAWYAARHIPYDAVDYRVWRNDTDWYEFAFIDSTISKNYPLDHKHTEYVNSKYRGLGYKIVADTICKNEEDIYNIQADLKYKLNMLLYKYPNKYMNYVRNAEQDKYKRRKDYCKNRQ